MDYFKINLSILNVFKECNIHSFPINCFELLELYGLKYKSYSSQSFKKREKCFILSDDAFTARKTVFYNDLMPNGRIRFSLMHELGHLILKHSGTKTEEQEREADCFASNIIAPRMAIHYSKCKNLNDVSKQFGLTHVASDYAFQNYRRWHRYVTYHKMSDIDKEMYNHFYNEEYKKFVFSMKKCSLCDKTLTNTNLDSCKSHHYIYEPRFHYQPDELELSLIRAENQWLYGGL